MTSHLTPDGSESSKMGSVEQVDKEYERFCRVSAAVNGIDGKCRIRMRQSAMFKMLIGGLKTPALLLYLILSLCYPQIEQVSSYKPDNGKFWLGPNYRGTHSTSRGISSLLRIFNTLPPDLIDDRYILALKTDDIRVYCEGFLQEFLNKGSQNVEVLELGCGEGRALGQLLAKFGEYHQLKGRCFNLKGYKPVKRGMPISGAVSSDSPAEIEKMLIHYNIHLPKGVQMPQVILGDASISPWPFSSNFLDLILSQATMSKITEVDIVVDEVLRTLKPGGFAALGLGGTFKCGRDFWQLPAISRQLFCQQISIDGRKATVALTMKSHFDNLREEQRVEWLQDHGTTYRGNMQTSLFVSKTDANHRSLLKCPTRSSKEDIVDLALRSCTHFTPAWDRGVRTLSNYLAKKRSNRINASPSE